MFFSSRFLELTDPLSPDVINERKISDESTFTSDFEMNLSISLFYLFLKMNKQYIFNNEVPHYFCLCESYENVSLLAEGLENACIRKEVPTDY